MSDPVNLIGSQNMELVYLVKNLPLKSALLTALLGLSIHLFPSGGLAYLFLKKTVKTDKSKPSLNPLIQLLLYEF